MTEIVRTTSVGEQVEVGIDAEHSVGITSYGLQAEVFDSGAFPPDPRVTAMYLQVEIGEYYITAKPIRTRPRPAVARVLPVSPGSRTGLL